MKLAAFWLSIFVLFLLVGIARADIGPKPSVTVYVKYNGANVSGTFYSAMLHCGNQSLAWSTKPSSPQLNIAQYDSGKGCYWEVASLAWGGTCSNSWCAFHYYPPTDTRLAFYLPGPNRTFITNEINNTNFSATYNVALYTTGAAIARNSGVSGYLIQFFIAIVLTEIVELTAAYVYLNRTNVQKVGRVLGTVFLGNIITVPILWFAFIPILGVPGFIIGEAFAFIFEGALVYALNKKKIALKGGMLMSVIMNFASLVIGLCLAFLLIMFGVYF